MPTPFRRQTFQAVSPLLDTALDLPPDQRAAWLADLRSRSPELAVQVADWLEACAAVEDDAFLQDATAVDPTRAALSGMEVGAYRLTEPVGAGGMGSVWLAARADGRFEARVAVKLLNAALVGRSGQERFAREGRILATLSHPNIAHLLDAGVSAIGQPYLVLEYVDGQDIVSYCSDRALGVEARVRLFLDVLGAVAHAHTCLVVHRDLKPSNVLVDADGRVKLLDFGIARLLTAADDPGAASRLTREGDAVLTPAFAAPEQVTRGTLTTATDTYALGVLLYLLLTEHHPAESVLDDPAALLHAIVHTDPPRPSEVAPAQRRRALRGDLDAIVARAMKKAPEERYASVGDFAADLRRYLAGAPIEARGESMAYRTGRFVMRHRWALSVAALIFVGLAVGLVVVNRARAEAELRFDQVRALSNRLFDLDVIVRQLSGSTRARQLIVDTALEYLEGLGGNLEGDPDLALDVGTAYMRVARVQGVPISANLGQMDAADATLVKAEAVIRQVLAAEPANGIAMLRAAQIAHDRMIIAGQRPSEDDALPLARQSAGWLDRYLAAGPVPATSLEQVLIALNNVGNRFRIAGELDEALRLTKRGLELARPAGDIAIEGQRGGLLIALTRIHRDRAELDEALVAIREAQQLLETPADRVATQIGRAQTLALALSTEGRILGAGRGIGLGRPREAVAPLQRAWDLMDPLAHDDPRNSLIRGSLASSGVALGDALVEVDAGRALDAYDHALRHMGEVPNNDRFRRDEAVALASSTRALARLGREDEIPARLEAAFERLATLRIYPADRLDLGSPADDVLSAQAEAYASRGQIDEAIRTYEQLLGLTGRSVDEAATDLNAACEVSRVYGALAPLLARAGRHDAARALMEKRAAMWRAWAARLPGNAYVARQVADTEAQAAAVAGR